MEKTRLGVLALFAACWIAVADAQDTPSIPPPLRASVLPQAVQLYAGIPMVYKRYSNTMNAPGKSSWAAQRSSTVVIQNVGESTGDAVLCLTPSVLDQFSLPPSQVAEVCDVIQAIPPGASRRVPLDSLGFLDDGFSGSARVYGSGPVTAVATHEFVDPDMLTISMASAVKTAAAGPDAYVPTLYWDIDGTLGTHAMSTLFAQNLDTVDNDVTVKLFRLGESLPMHTALFHLAPGRAARLDIPSALANLFTSFNGSATVHATRAVDGSAGRVGAHVFELAAGKDGGTYNQAKAYVGFTRGSLKLNMATALCEAFGSLTAPAQSTAYAIQNVSRNPAQVTVVFQPGYVPHSLTIPAFSKASLQTCAVMAHNFSGSATIYSNQPIVAIGKAFVAGQPAGTGTSTAFEGVESGASRLSIPFINWSTDITYVAGGARSNIAVQNVGTADVDGVIARYFTTAGSYQDISLGRIAAGGKVNTSPKGLEDSTGTPSPVENAIVRDGLGSVEIKGPAGSELAAVVRVNRRKPFLGGVAISEDYVAHQQKAAVSCECKLYRPDTLQHFEPYIRERITANNAYVTGVCPLPKLDFPSGYVAGSAYGADCNECATKCQSDTDREGQGVFALYYNLAITAPPLGEPPEFPYPEFDANVQIDLDEMIAKDPCGAKSFKFEFIKDSCKPAN